jgi:hypothetical protein
MKRKEKELCSSDSLLFRMNAFGTRLIVNSAFVLLLVLSYRTKTVSAHLRSRYE